MNLSHGIDDYIRSLNLPTDGTDNFVSIVTEPHREPPNKQRRIPITTGKDAKLPKGSDWDNPLFPQKNTTQSPPIHLRPTGATHNLMQLPPLLG